MQLGAAWHVRKIASVRALIKLTNQSESIVVLAQLWKHERCNQQPNHERCWQDTILEFAQLELALQNRTVSALKQLAVDMCCTHAARTHVWWNLIAHVHLMATWSQHVGQQIDHIQHIMLQDYCSKMHRVIRRMRQRAAAAAGCERSRLAVGLLQVAVYLDACFGLFISIHTITGYDTSVKKD